MTRRRRTVLIAAFASAGAVAVAVPALTARGGGGDPPTVSGPLALNDQRCFQKGDRFVCAFDYLLDPSTTDDPADAWHGYWASSAIGGARQARVLHDRGRRAAYLAGPGEANPNVSFARLEQGRAWRRGAPRG